MQSASVRSNRCRARRASSSTGRRRAGVGELHQVRAVVADLLHRHQRRVPVDRALVRHEVLVLAAAVVVHVRRDQVLGRGLDRVGDVAHQVRVAEVEADAGVRRVEVPLEHRDQRRRRRTARSGSPRARPARRAARPARQISSTLRSAGAAVVVARLRSSPPACRGARPARRTGSRRAICSAASASRTAACRRALSVDGVRVASPPLSPSPKLVGDRRVDAVQRQPGLRQPLRQPLDRGRRRGSRSGVRVANSSIASKP